MKYVKLVARPGTWFKVGTEVYDYDCTEDKKIRITLDDWNKWVKSGMVLVRGVRINKSHQLGEEYFDYKCCNTDELDEFDVTIVNEPSNIPIKEQLTLLL